MKNGIIALKAFTLAEVLIVLGIIGIIAELTIPTLLNNVNESQQRVGYKKAYSVASQAWMRAVSEENIVSRSGWADAASTVANFNAFKAYFKILKDCDNLNNSECWATGGEGWYSDYPKENAPAFVDNSGMVWSLPSNGATGAVLFVDTNGSKKPNKFGQDRFPLYTLSASFPTADDSAYDNLDLYGVGLPVKLVPQNDFVTRDASRCPSGDIHPCLYKSWLFGK